MARSTALPASPDVGRAWPRFPLLYRALRAPLRGALERWFQLSVEGAEHLPHRGPYLVAANHHNYLDGVVLGVSVPAPIAFLVMPRVWRATPLHPAFHRHIGSIPLHLDRADVGALRRALTALERGRVVGIFPEGPFSVRGRLERALARARLLSDAERDAIVKGLEAVRAELEGGTFPFRPELEDIHTNVERRLVELVGEIGGKLHTGRSRNDQIALDERMYLKDAITRARDGLRAVQAALVARAGETSAAPMPGYTHLQRAQPIVLAHHLLAYVFMLERDRERLAGCAARADRLPLGAAALAGTAFPIDREALARELGFGGVTSNSLDAVSDRDYVLEYLAAAAITGMHFSRLAADLTLWATAEFGFVEFSDAFATGSSIMPQKKNPDVAELVRGKSGRLYGNLVAVLTTMKGLPL